MTQPERPRVAVLSLGREQAMGDARRVRSWTAVLEAAACDVHPIRLLPDHRAGALAVARQAPRLATAVGDVVPEAGLWDWRRTIAALRAAEPDAVVAVTSRCLVPGIAAGPWTTVLDLVDRLSVSYTDRAALAGTWWARAGYRALARRARAVEQRSSPEVRRVAASHTEAPDLSATWIPNMVEPLVVPPGHPDHDLVFVGTLGYPPNVAAVLRMDVLWDRFVAARPSISMLVAGARPVPEVVAAARRRGWTLAADFRDLGAVLGRARLAVAPLRHASGLQNKVLDAAAAGIAQVVDPTALAGFDPDLPVPGPADDDAFVETVLDLLNDERARVHQRTAARAHVLQHYDTASWTDVVRRLVAP